MADEESAQVSMDASQIPLPPVFEHFISELSKDRKKLLRDKAFAESAQLRNYIGQFLFPRFIELVRLLAGMGIESYSLAASNTNELRRLHYFVVEQLHELGADLDAEDAKLPGVSADVLNDFQQAFYALGTLLQSKYPDDAETEASYNRVAACVSELVSELMDGYGYDDGDDDGDDDEDDDDSDDGDEDGDSDQDDALPKDVSAELEGASDEQSESKEGDDD